MPVYVHTAMVAYLQHEMAAWAFSRSPSMIEDSGFS